MNVDDWLDKEMDALEALYQKGELSAEQYRRQSREILRDADEMAARQDIIGAGRGHLLK